MRDGWLALAEWVHEVADADLAGGRGSEDAEYPQPDRIGQCGEPTGQLSGIVGIERRIENRGTALLRQTGPWSQLSVFTIRESPIDEYECIDHTRCIDSRKCHGRQPVSRVQLALNVTDIDESVVFYSKLFGAEPTKREPGYANFAISDPPLKLVLMEAHGTAW